MSFKLFAILADTTLKPRTTMAGEFKIFRCRNVKQNTLEVEDMVATVDTVAVAVVVVVAAAADLVDMAVQKM